MFRGLGLRVEGVRVEGLGRQKCVGEQVHR